MFASLGTAALRFGCGVASQERSPRDVREPGDSSAEVWVWGGISGEESSGCSRAWGQQC